MTDKSVVYHGTTAGPIERFKPRLRRGEQLGFGVHFARDRDFAMEYATNPNVARRGRRPTLICASLSVSQTLVANAIVSEGSDEFELAHALAGKRFFYARDLEGRRACYLQNAIDATSPERALRLIQEAGYDSVAYEASLRTATVSGHYQSLRAGLSITVLDATKIEIVDCLELRREAGLRQARAALAGEEVSPGL